MSEITIEQLRDGVRSGPPLLLESSYLPNQGVDTPTRQRIVRSLAPGADRPVVHVLGPELEGFDLAGSFNDGVSGDTNGAIVTLQRLVGLCRDGYPVRLVWALQGTNLWEYEGFIERVTPTWADGFKVIGWSLRFEPMSSQDGTGNLKLQRAFRRGEEDINRTVATVLAIGLAAQAVQRAAATSRAIAHVALVRAA